MSASSYSWCMYSHKVNIIGCMYIYVYTNKYFVTCRMLRAPPYSRTKLNRALWLLTPPKKRGMWLRRLFVLCAVVIIGALLVQVSSK